VSHYAQIAPQPKRYGNLGHLRSTVVQDRGNNGSPYMPNLQYQSYQAARRMVDLALATNQKISPSISATANSTIVPGTPLPKPRPVVKPAIAKA
jgi:hypothetical protein